MKRLFVMMLALLPLLGLAARAEKNPTNTFVGRWKDARVASAEMRILPEYLEQEGDGDLVIFPITFTWDSSADRQVVWTMTARYNEKTGRLEYTDGAKIEGGGAAWRDARGSLALDAAGNLIWTDSREKDSAKLSFVRYMTPAPTAQEFADGYFRVVAGLERGTSGAALKAARTIVRVLVFAQDHDLWNADGAEMQANLEAAWDSLDAGERAYFDAAFIDGVSDPADEALDDYDAYRRVFDEAGVGVAMARLAANPEVRLSWEFLSSATLNMGNMNDDYRGETVG